MDKYFMWIHYERLHNHNKAKHNKTVCIFLGIYCTMSPSVFLLLLVLTGVWLCCSCHGLWHSCSPGPVLAFNVCTGYMLSMIVSIGFFFGNKYMQTQDIKGYSYDSRNIRTPRIIHIANIFLWDRSCCPKYTVWRMGNCICFVLRSMCSI